MMHADPCYDVKTIIFMHFSSFNLSQLQGCKLLLAKSSLDIHFSVNDTFLVCYSKSLVLIESLIKAHIWFNLSTTCSEMYLIQLTSAGLRPSREKLAGDGGRDDPMKKIKLLMLYMIVGGKGNWAQIIYNNPNSKYICTIFSLQIL